MNKMQFEVIKSLSNPQIKFLRKLLKGDSKSNFFILEGYHLVEEALKINLIKKIYELENNNFYKKISNDIEYNQVTYEVLKSISSTQNPQGIIGLCELQNNKDIYKSKKIIFLDNVQDPGNVGTIIRLAAAFNFDTVIGNVAFNNNKLIRSTQGAILKINYFQIKNIDNLKFIQDFKNKNYSIISTSLEKDSYSFNDFKFNKNEKQVLIFGNEGKGIQKEILKLSSSKIYIPINFESINVACAVAIFLNKIENN